LHDINQPAVVSEAREAANGGFLALGELTIAANSRSLQATPIDHQRHSPDAPDRPKADGRAARAAPAP